MSIRRRIGTLIALGLAHLVPITLAAYGSEQAAESSLVLEQFSAGAPGRDLTLPVTFAGRTYQFVVDTGCEFTIFDQTIRPRLGRAKESARLVGLNGRATVELFEAPD